MKQRTFPLVVSIFREGGGSAAHSHSHSPSPAPSGAAEHLKRMAEEAMTHLATARALAIAGAKTAVEQANTHLQALRVYESNAEALDLPSAACIIKEVEQWEAYFHDIVNNEGIFADDPEDEPAPAPKGKPSKPAPIRKRAPSPAPKPAPKKGK